MNGDVSAMNPIDWLCDKVPRFSDLSCAERLEIMHFVLLWSLFEAKALDTRASAERILALSHKWAQTGRLTIDSFAQSLNYFRDRYFKEGVETDHFSRLNFRRNDNQALVRAVLKGEITNIADSVAALLIVVFRLRNNLFHGLKWADGIRGQLSNFANANVALIAALEMHNQF
ncbi:MAG: hypothetical protein U0411_12475 [Thermodesulfovibrionales bacterium]